MITDPLIEKCLRELSTITSLLEDYDQLSEIQITNRTHQLLEQLNNQSLHFNHTMLILKNENSFVK